MRRIVRSLSSVLFCIAAVGVGGCMVGPKYSRPVTAADEAPWYVHGSGHDEDADASADLDQWWRQFGDPVTAELVQEALANNLDLKAAAARVLQAHAMLVEARGRRLPDVGYGVGRNRSKMSFNLGDMPAGDPNGPALPFSGGRFTVLTTTWSQDISVMYMLDLFGKLKHAQRAAWADLLAAGAGEQALVNGIVATVVKARIDIATTQRRLALAKANTASWRETVDIVERRYREGLVGPLDVRMARENLDASLAAEPALEMSLALARHALDVLVARRPGTGEALPETLEDLPDLSPVPIGLPAALLDRRPDVQAAELALRAGNERVGVSIAQLLPDLTLTAAYGASADRWRDIWSTQSETYSLLTNLAQPIFRGGQLKAQIAAAKARYEELAAVYSNTVLTAMREVEDALVSEKMLQKQLEHLTSQSRQAKAAEDLSRTRYEQGVERLLTVLESERRRRLAEDQLALLKGQLWTTRVNLHLALGGDWDSDTEPERQMVKR